MQENHSFDNYFGTYPGAKGIPKKECMLINVSDPADGCVKPFELNASSYVKLDHNFSNAYTDWNNGSMNNFIAGQGYNNDTMGYYTNATIPNYWTYANNYVLADNFYSSVFGWSLPNHWLAMSGNTPACAMSALCPHQHLNTYLNESNGIPTIADLLINTSVSWNYYDYVLGTNYTQAVYLAKHEKSGGGHGLGGGFACDPDNHTACDIWNPFAAQNRSYSLSYSPHFVQNTQIFTDLSPGGHLPDVSYVIPNDNVSEHPPANITLGMDWVTSIINAVMNSRYWNSSAIVLTWDDYGGFYDNVAPPLLKHKNECIALLKTHVLNPDCYLGFRVPTLIISPYAKRGFIDTSMNSFESILKFIEWNWHLPAITHRDADANNLLAAFDFKAGPINPPTVIPMSAATANYVISQAAATGPDTD